MPVKNAEPFLKDCVSSILLQTEKNWELIAIDDHSTDNSRKVLDHFAETDKRIRVLSNTGNGIIDALRTAYANSSGRLITRMDADDRMSDNKLRAMKADLLANGKGHIALGLVEYFSDVTLGDGYRYYQTWLNELTASGTNYKDIYRECVIPSPCWMVYREDLDVCKAFKPNVYPEEYDLCFRFYKNKLKPIPSSRTLHYWRDHAARTSRNDPHYADNRFLELKLNWFLKVDHEPTRPLVIWGAALKGKNLAKDLIRYNVDFNWACNNPNKIGKVVYDQKINHLKVIGELNHPQIIIAVANKDEQRKIKQQLESEGFE